MKVVYVIGPFRAATQWEIHNNVLVAESLGLEVARLGAMPLVPHKNTENFHGLLTDEFWIEGTKVLASRADAGITVEALGREWKHSVGSRGEVDLFADLGRPVFHSLPNLKAWLESSRG